MADPRAAAKPAAPPKPAAEETKVENAGPGYSAADSAELTKLRAEVQSMREEKKRVSVAIRKLAAAILTPSEEGASGQGRRNSIAQAIQALVKEFGIDQDE